MGQTKPPSRGIVEGVQWDRTRWENTSVKNVFFRIDRYAIQMNFVMYMGTSTSAGIPHRGNLVPAFNRFSALGDYFIQMPVTGQHAVPMIDDDRITKQSLTAGK